MANFRAIQEIFAPLEIIRYFGHDDTKDRFCISAKLIMGLICFFFCLLYKKARYWRLRWYHLVSVEEINTHEIPPIISTTRRIMR